ncbi:MAG TPA: hypothetical protein VMT38_04030 [Terracidiphilus sp.]|nr:hypothetical protein [Terracidiphilus sp.]
MNTRGWSVFTGLCGVAVFALSAIPSGAQATEVKEKPAMYTYVADWQFPRDRWGDVEKVNAADDTIFQAAMADGTLVGYGNDVNEVHTVDGNSHDTWWSSMSIAGLMKVLDKLKALPPADSPIALNPAKHWDTVLVSHYYNWKPGAYTGAYLNVAMYQLKPNADDDAVETLSKSVVVPMLEKMLADGTILEYEVDTEAIHTDAPGLFAIVYVTPQAEGIDTVRAAIRASQHGNPLIGAAFDSYVDYTQHRDELLKGNGAYK